jgi:tetratricopeptide (TPR) repeat protein
VNVIPRVKQGDFAPPRAIVPSIDRALESVCLRAMALRPEDRHGSCRAVAEDIERWLADEPVSAWREPLLTGLARWSRRHRTVVASLIALLATDLTAASIALALVNHARNRAIVAEQVERAALITARVEEGKAKQSEAEARAVLGFFQSRVVAAARPKGLDGGLGRIVSLREAIDAAEPSIAADFASQPAVEAAIRDSIGQSYDYLGEPSLAIQQLERARALRAATLGPDHLDTLDTLAKLAQAYRDAGRANEALPLNEEIFTKYKARLGADDALE